MPFKFRIDSLHANSNAYPRGRHLGNWLGLSDVDKKLISDNIKWGVNVFGIIGTMVQWQTQVNKTLAIPVPSVNAELVVTNGGQFVAEPALTIPLPTVTPTLVQATPSDPNMVVSHDDDPPSDIDKTAEANSDPVIDQTWLSNSDNKENVTGATWKAMTFTPSADHIIKGVRLCLYGSNVGLITVSIRATTNGLPSGVDLCSGTLDGAQLSSIDNNQVFDIPLGAGAALTTGTVYAIVLRAASGTLYWKSSPDGYAGGNKCSSTNSGSSWTADTTRDLLFEEFGLNSLDVPATPNPSAVGDGLYIGGVAPFDYTDVWVNQAGVGTYSITWKYWDGTTWSPLTLTSDGDKSNSWKRPGRHTIHFVRPANWQTTTILASDLYWIKGEVTAYTSQTVQPLLGRIWIGAY